MSTHPKEKRSRFQRAYDRLIHFFRALTFFMPRCTIANGWNASEGLCGKRAISCNDWGGLRCEFHSSIKRCPTNPIGPCPEIRGSDLKTKLRLQIAYIGHLKSRARELRKL